MKVSWGYYSQYNQNMENHKNSMVPNHQPEFIRGFCLGYCLGTSTSWGHLMGPDIGIQKGHRGHRSSTIRAASFWKKTWEVCIFEE